MGQARGSYAANQRAERQATEVERRRGARLAARDAEYRRLLGLDPVQLIPRQLGSVQGRSPRSSTRLTA